MIPQIHPPPRRRHFVAESATSSDKSHLYQTARPPSHPPLLCHRFAHPSPTNMLRHSRPQVPFCFEYLESRPCRIYSAPTFSESLFKSSRVVGANIASVKRYRDHNGVLHRFLILHVVRTDGKDLYLRLDHRRSPEVPLWAFRMRGLQTCLAKDTFPDVCDATYAHYLTGRNFRATRTPP